MSQRAWSSDGPFGVWEDPELSHEVVVVEDRPVLDQFAVDDAVERDECRHDGSACGRDSVVVAGVGAAIGPAAGHVVAVDDDLFEDDRLVGEPLKVGGYDGSELIWSVQFGEPGPAAHDLRIDRSVEHGEVVVIVERLVEAHDQATDAFCGHGSSLGRTGCPTKRRNHRRYGGTGVASSSRRWTPSAAAVSRALRRRVRLN